MATKMVSFKFPSEAIAKLGELAEKWGVSKTAVLVLLIRRAKI